MSRGFTLLEVLVAMVILGVAAGTTLLVQASAFASRARVSRTAEMARLAAGLLPLNLGESQAEGTRPCPLDHPPAILLDCTISVAACPAGGSRLCGGIDPGRAHLVRIEMLYGEDQEFTVATLHAEFPP